MKPTKIALSRIIELGYNRTRVNTVTVLILSGKRQGVLKSDVCGNHDVHVNANRVVFN